MDWPTRYNSLQQNVFTEKGYSIVPIRYEDRISIMKWRNEQMYHLRQEQELKPSDQDFYFDEVVKNLFFEKHPTQYLFSFLESGRCIGYGGLVHIDWTNKNAEISFLMDTSLEAKYFELHWTSYLGLIEKLAFGELNFHKIYTYAYDLRPRLFEVLKACKFRKEATLKEHYFHKEKFIDVVYHSKFNRSINLRLADIQDEDITYEWAIDESIRKHSFSQGFITREDHNKWFSKKLSDKNCKYYIAEYNKSNVGSFRLDINERGEALISLLLGPKSQGLGLGYELLREGVKCARKENHISTLLGEVKVANTASRRVFERIGFQSEKKDEDVLRFKLDLYDNQYH